jgi:hypothetical protein
MTNNNPQGDRRPTSITESDQRYLTKTPSGKAARRGLRHEAATRAVAAFGARAAATLNHITSQAPQRREKQRGQQQKWQPQQAI